MLFRSVTLSVSVAATYGTVPTGTIELLDGVASLGTCALENGACAFADVAFHAGIHQLSAWYSGDADHAASSSDPIDQEIVAQPTTTTLASSNPASTFGELLTLAVSVTPVEATGEVSILDGNELLGTCTLSNATCSIETAALAAALGAPVHDLGRFNQTLEDMLALLHRIDIYAGVSNTNTHLRAGTGRIAHVLIPHPPEWRWMIRGARSPWFPDFPLYRQAYGDQRASGWEAALAALRRDVAVALNAGLAS